MTIQNKKRSFHFTITEAILVMQGYSLAQDQLFANEKINAITNSDDFCRNEFISIHEDMQEAIEIGNLPITLKGEPVPYKPDIDWNDIWLVAAY